MSTHSTERTVASGDAEIVTEAFGDPADPAVLLIMGQMASMLWWPEGLCRQLAAAGCYVIRYDNRDTGRSTSYEPGAPPYDADDLTDDAVAVLDGYGLGRAHVAGMSMGGMIAQLVELRYPERVASLTVISSTALADTGAELPGPDPAYLEHAAAAEQLDWTDVDAIAEFIVRDARATAGVAHPFDEQAARESVARDLARTRRPQSLVNHSLLGGEDPPAGELRAPLTVIHGTADPLFPPAHGIALAESVPGASLVLLEGGGHELHQAHWDQIIESIVLRTAA